MGKRENEPAKGRWIVPGGTVLKNERRKETVHRLANDELGEPVTVNERPGTFEHFYDTSEVDDVDSKHYVATAYRCHFERDNVEILPNQQHDDLRFFQPPFEDFHPHVMQYLDML